jgi:uncharacterized membrane protein YgcG
MIFRNRRAADVFSMLFYLLFGLMLATFFIIAVVTKVKSAVADSTYQKRFYARDMALIVDAMHASNGDMNIKYEMLTPEKMRLDAAIEPGKIFLTDSSDTPLGQRDQTSFYFGYNLYTNAVPAVMSSDTINFEIFIRDRNISFRGYFIGKGGRSGGGGATGTW